MAENKPNVPKERLPSTGSSSGYGTTTTPSSSIRPSENSENSDLTRIDESQVLNPPSSVLPYDEATAAADQE